MGQERMRSWSLPIWLMLATGCAPLNGFAPEAAQDPSPTRDQQELALERGQDDRGCPPFAAEGAASAIRSPDAVVRALFVEGCRKSPTFRQLVGAVGRTDGVVYITIGACPLRILRGCLMHAIQDTGNARYLWIRLTAHADASEFVAVMAHEVQHALEVLTQTTVRSQRDLLHFYQSFESLAYRATSVESPFRTYETRAAINVAAAVRAELANRPGALSADDRD